MQVNIDGKWIEAPDPVVNRMQENYDTMVSMNTQLDTLRAAVHDMRHKQALCKRTPKSFNLIDDAKAAEKIVDNLLAGKPSQETSKQNSIF